MVEKEVEKSLRMSSEVTELCLVLILGYLGSWNKKLKRFKFLSFYTFFFDLVHFPLS